MLPLESMQRESPGGPVVRAQRSHCQGLVQSLIRELRYHKLRSRKKTKTPKPRKQTTTLLLVQTHATGPNSLEEAQHWGSHASSAIQGRI